MDRLMFAIVCVIQMDGQMCCDVWEGVFGDVREVWGERSCRFYVGSSMMSMDNTS